MRGTITRPGLLFLGVMIPLSSFSYGCAHVKPQELEDRLSLMGSELRNEINEGDARLGTRLDGRIDGLETRVDALERALAEMERDFNAQIERLASALRFNVPVHFGFDEADVRAQDFALLDRFAEVVTEYYPSSIVTVEGFTDPSGSAAYNQRLGQRRADGVKNYLVEQGGLSSDRLRAVSYGEAGPRLVAQGAQGPGESGWENRRVVLVIDHSGG